MIDCQSTLTTVSQNVEHATRWDHDGDLPLLGRHCRYPPLMGPGQRSSPFWGSRSRILPTVRSLLLYLKLMTVWAWEVLQDVHDPPTVETPLQSHGRTPAFRGSCGSAQVMPSSQTCTFLDISLGDRDQGSEIWKLPHRYQDHRAEIGKLFQYLRGLWLRMRDHFLKTLLLGSWISNWIILGVSQGWWISDWIILGVQHRSRPDIEKMFGVSRQCPQLRYFSNYLKVVKK